MSLAQSSVVVLTGMRFFKQLSEIRQWRSGECFQSIERVIFVGHVGRGYWGFETDAATILCLDDDFACRQQRRVWKQNWKRHYSYKKSWRPKRRRQRRSFRTACRRYVRLLEVLWLVKACVCYTRQSLCTQQNMTRRLLHSVWGVREATVEIIVTSFVSISRKPRSVFTLNRNGGVEWVAWTVHLRCKTQVLTC